MLQNVFRLTLRGIVIFALTVLAEVDGTMLAGRGMRVRAACVTPGRAYGFSTSIAKVAEAVSRRMCSDEAEAATAMAGGNNDNGQSGGGDV